MRLEEEDTFTLRCCLGVWGLISTWKLLPFTIMGEAWEKQAPHAEMLLRPLGPISRWRLVPVTNTEETLGEGHTNTELSGIWKVIARWRLVPFTKVGETGGEEDTVTLRCSSACWTIAL